MCFQTVETAPKLDSGKKGVCIGIYSVFEGYAYRGGGDHKYIHIYFFYVHVYIYIHIPTAPAIWPPSSAFRGLGLAEPGPRPGGRRRRFGAAAARSRPFGGSKPCP